MFALCDFIFANCIFHDETNKDTLWRKVWCKKKKANCSISVEKCQFWDFIIVLFRPSVKTVKDSKGVSEIQASCGRQMLAAADWPRSLCLLPVFKLKETSCFCSRSPLAVASHQIIIHDTDHLYRHIRTFETDITWIPEEINSVSAL